MRARVFIGSSLKALEVAEQVRTQFEDHYDVTLWNKNVFRPGESFLDSLLRTANHCNFGIFVFAADDALETTEIAVRDNVIFECGMFFGKVGRRRSFFLVPRDVKNLHWPTDLSGVSPAHYQSDCRDIAEACTAIEEMMEEELHADERTSLNGDWEETWEVPGTSIFSGKNQARAEVLHIGNQFLAVCHDERLPFSLKGIVEWPFITGTWASNPEGGRGYFGAFQLRMHSFGHKLDGRMVGFDQEGIQTGTWCWERPAEWKAMALKKNATIANPARKEPALKRLLANIWPKNLHAEVDWGKPRGKEAW